MMDIKPKDRIEVTTKDEQRKHLKLIGRIRPHRGHKLFKLQNGVVSEVREDEFEFYYDFDRKRKVKKVIVESDTAYVSALNLKNAIRKFKKSKK